MVLLIECWSIFKCKTNEGASYGLIEYNQIIPNNKQIT